MTLQRLVHDLSAYDLAISVPYAIALSLIAAEVAWLARRPGPGRRAILMSAATASTMALVAVVIGIAYTAVLRQLWGAGEAIRWDAGAAFWSNHPYIGAAATFLALDAVGWVYHVIGHRTRLGWAAHQPHHTGSHFDATLGLRQTWVPFHGLLLHPLLVFPGFNLRIVFACAAISNCWQLLEHTSMPVRFPRWFSENVMTPAAHRHHHGLEGGLVNLGPCFTWWDRIAGTWRPAEAPAPEAYGLENSVTANPFRIEGAGWAALIKGFRRRLALASYPRRKMPSG